MSLLTNLKVLLLLVTYNVIIIAKVFHLLNTNHDHISRDAYVLKIDMTKAYDRVGARA